MFKRICEIFPSNSIASEDWMVARVLNNMPTPKPPPKLVAKLPAATVNLPNELLYPLSVRFLHVDGSDTVQ